MFEERIPTMGWMKIRSYLFTEMLIKPFKAQSLGKKVWKK